jgi:hypothetical protein
LIATSPLFLFYFYLNPHMFSFQKFYGEMPYFHQLFFIKNEVNYIPFWICIVPCIHGMRISLTETLWMGKGTLDLSTILFDNHVILFFNFDYFTHTCQVFTFDSFFIIHRISWGSGLSISWAPGHERAHVTLQGHRFYKSLTYILPEPPYTYPTPFVTPYHVVKHAT